MLHRTFKLPAAELVPRGGGLSGCHRLGDGRDRSNGWGGQPVSFSDVSLSEPQMRFAQRGQRLVAALLRVMLWAILQLERRECGIFRSFWTLRVVASW